MDVYALGQVAENVENVGQNILVGSMDISFGGFNRGAASSSSTQMPQPEADDVLRNFRTSNGAEDDVFTELMDFDQFDNIDKHIDKYLENEQNTLAQGFGAATGGSSSRPTPKPSAPRADALAEKKQLEIQTKMLCEQRTRIQGDNDRLQNEVSKLNEKCQSKDGEVCCLLA